MGNPRANSPVLKVPLALRPMVSEIFTPWRDFAVAPLHRLAAGCRFRSMER